MGSPIWLPPGRGLSSEVPRRLHRAERFRASKNFRNFEKFHVLRKDSAAVAGYVELSCDSCDPQTRTRKLPLLMESVDKQHEEVVFLSQSIWEGICDRIASARVLCLGGFIQTERNTQTNKP